MKESRGDIFYAAADAVCITTNGFTKANGQAVMGRGCAHKAVTIFPNLPYLLGNKLRNEGNVVHELLESLDRTILLSYPVKPVSKTYHPDSVVKHMVGKFKEGSQVPGWACKADIDLIQESAKQLVALTDLRGWKTVVLPRPGCGAGELDWNTVKPILENVLDDRFTCMTF